MRSIKAEIENQVDKYKAWVKLVKEEVAAEAKALLQPAS